jgi:hypothetical protein
MFDLHGRLVSLLERYIDRNIRAPIVVAVDPLDGDRFFATHLWHKHAEARQTSWGYFVTIEGETTPVDSTDLEQWCLECPPTDDVCDHTLAASLAEPHLDQCECGSWFVTKTITRSDPETVKCLWTCHVCDRELDREEQHLPARDSAVELA